MNRLRDDIKKVILILLTGTILLPCCKKDFLDKKPSSDLVVPSTLDDFQALLDNDKIIQETPELGELSADNYYLPDSFWLQNLSIKEHNAYIWAADIYEGQGNVDDWDLPYTQVYYANYVLEGLKGIPVESNDIVHWKTLQGTACFIRAYAFYNLAQLFSNVYDAGIVDDSTGIPLRLKSDPRVTYPRSTVQDTYKQIIQDLKQADSLLPAAIRSSDLNRPSRPAVLAMLARVYLSMRDYADARIYADSCLQLYNVLMDYHTVMQAEPGTPIYFSATNPETLYQSHFLSNSGVFFGLVYPAYVDSNLYRSYADSDLRKTMFYTPYGIPTIQGSYGGVLFPFSGLATDEVYLIRAECLARAGKKDSALNDLDTLLIKRWAPGNFVPYDPATMSQTDVLDTVLAERRKELAFRGLRWTDLRRLNADTFHITLTRLVFGTTYKLRPADHELYTMPIPPDVISLSGIKQNQR